MKPLTLDVDMLGATRPVQLTLTWAPRDPGAVRLQLVTPFGPRQWVTHRSVLANGLFVVAPSLDAVPAAEVTVCPLRPPTPGRALVLLTLVGSRRRWPLVVDGVRIAEFVVDTYDEVSEAREAELISAELDVHIDLFRLFTPPPDSKEDAA